MVTHFSNSKSTKWQEQQISANPVSTLGPLSTMMMELSNICFVLVFECGRPVLQSSALPLSVHSSRGGRPWIELSEKDKSVPLGPANSSVIPDSFRNSEYLITFASVPESTSVFKIVLLMLTSIIAEGYFYQTLSIRLSFYLGEFPLNHNHNLECHHFL